MDIKTWYLFVICSLTVVSMHGLSLTAPQHPKKAVMKITEPMTIDKIGAILKLSGITLVTSVMLSLNNIPTIINANPIS